MWHIIYLAKDCEIKHVVTGTGLPAFNQMIQGLTHENKKILGITYAITDAP